MQTRDALPYFATPHDQTLSAIHHQAGIADGNTTPKINRSANASPIESMSSPCGGGAVTPPLHAGVSLDSPLHREVLTDPYDGTILGTLHMPFSTDPGSTSGDKIWTQLSRITDLQTEIARMHVDMEGIGAKKGKGKSGERKDRRHGKGSRQSQSDGWSEEDEDEGDTGMDDEERQEEFARLADQFEGRKESIKEIMAKLDDLSKALTEFHSL